MCEIGSQESTLVKYDHPQLITCRSINPTLSEISGAEKPPLTQKSKVTWSIAAICLEVLCQLETEDILNIILPAKEWQDGVRKWRQQVSSVPATDADVQNLLHRLDSRMMARRAKETGICPVRRELYSQCLDELIRQVTIICAERGVLLLRIRDEIKMTIAAYESLYISGTAYSIRRNLLNQLTHQDLEAHMDRLNHERDQLSKDETSLRQELQKIIAENDVVERKERDARALEIENLKKINAELKRQMETSLAFKKRAAAVPD
jgi:dynein light intermediate chain